jgi:glutamate-1-semialdehyde 2,1-aminomutase
MHLVAPAGPMYQAGTLSGNPLAMAAGNAMLSLLQNDPSIYNQLEARASVLGNGIQHIIDARELPLMVNRVGSMFTLFFTPHEVTDYESAKTSNVKNFASFFNSMLDQGIYLAPSQFEATFISAAHTDEDIGRTIEAAKKALS